MELIVAIVIIGGLIWFGLAVIGSRRDANGMDAQDRYYHRKAVRQTLERQAERDGHATADLAIGFAESEGRLMEDGLTAKQALEVSKARVSRHRGEAHARPLWECPACDEATGRDAERVRLACDDPEMLRVILDERDRSLGISPTGNRELVEELREQLGESPSWSSSATEPSAKIHAT